ncbi:hypothetical protein [Campylobacter sp. US33a]|uniref:hypothetical protein n=1 Tax=Campylobacter sp. US33a TaxID=2498120 RepID=UPI0010672507|nr:hypothetical protein [Campylobacter sp. US33a]TEY00729.1 hypothetical protein ELQ16_08830 [Campylobacter sp. US33a]
MEDNKTMEDNIINETTSFNDGIAYGVKESPPTPVDRIKQGVANIRDSYEALCDTFEQNKNDRKGCFENSNDLLLTKTLFEALRDFLSEHKKTIDTLIEAQDNMSLGMNLKENKKLSKELIVSSIESEIKENIELSQDLKNAELAKLNNEDNKNLIYDIAKTSIDRFNDEILKSFKEDGTFDFDKAKETILNNDVLTNEDIYQAMGEKYQETNKDILQTSNIVNNTVKNNLKLK